MRSTFIALPSRLALSAAIAVAAMAGQVHAQDTAAPATPAVDDKVADIVVTAQKRASSLQTTSLAMTALGGETLKDKSVVNVEGLTRASPSFSFASQGPTSAVNIRGIGLGVSSPNVSPGVPIYRDGLLAPTLLASEPFLDVSSVEVLRGPQGTLIGANSTGGAVFINTANPVLGHYEGYAEVEGGSYNKLRAAGAINVPVSDTFAVRGAASVERRDSYWTNLQPSLTTPEPGATRQFALRGSALYQPSDKFSALLKVNYQQDDNGGWAHTPYAGTPAAVDYPTTPYVLSYGDNTTSSRDHQIRAGLELKYAFDSGITLKSITGTFQTRQFYDDNQYINISATTATAGHYINRIKDELYTQEFNLVSPASRKLHWVLGNFNLLQYSNIALTPNNPNVLVAQGTPRFSTAFYGEVGYTLSPSLEIHAGLRETFNHVTGNGGTYSVASGSPVLLAVNSTRFSDHQLTGRIGIDWTLSNEQFLYASFAKGGKTGGVNGTGLANFASESVYDWELGAKSKWLDGHLRTQVGGFYMDYQNLQLSSVGPRVAATPGSAIVNAGSATIYGAEASAQFKAGGLSIDGNLSYVHSSVSVGTLLNSLAYQSAGLNPTGLQCATGQTTGCFNYTPYYQSASGGPSPYSPTWTGNIGAGYDLDLGNRLTLTPRVDFSYMSAQWTTVFQNAAEQLQARKLINANITLKRDRWKIVGYGTNLTKQYYITGQTGFQNFYGAPREFGVRINTTF